MARFKAQVWQGRSLGPRGEGRKVGVLVSSPSAPGGLPQRRDARPRGGGAGQTRALGARGPPRTPSRLRAAGCGKGQLLNMQRSLQPARLAPDHFGSSTGFFPKRLPRHTASWGPGPGVSSPANSGPFLASPFPAPPPQLPLPPGPIPLPGLSSSSILPFPSAPGASGDDPMIKQRSQKALAVISADAVPRL